jgi:WD40 repeat protein
MLAGTPPYRAKTARELLRAVKTAPPPPIDHVQPGTPRDLVSIITKAMARDPDARYPSARELADELKRFQTGRLVEAHVYSRYELFKRFLRRHRAVVTVSALALAISVTFGTIAVVNILRSRAEARETVRELILEKGRIELLAGNTQRALAYFYDVYQRGADGPTLQFLLGSALRGLSSSKPLDCGGSARTIAFDRGGKYVAAGCTEVAKVWRLADGRELASVKTGDVGFSNVRFSPDGSTLATWGESGVARLWNPETGELRATFDHGRATVGLDEPIEINRLSFTPDGARVATTGSDGLAIIWDVARGEPARVIVGSTAPLRAVRSMYGWLDPTGKRLYSMTPTGIGYGWDVETGESLGVREHGSVAIGADLSPDGRLGLSCGADGRIRTWDLFAAKPVHQFAGHTEPVWKCIFSSDSKLALSGGHDGRANVYDLASGQVITSVHHGDIVINADFSPDARRFATVGMTGRVKLWDTRTGALLANLDSVRGKDARFAPDNQHLVATRGDGRIQIWRFERPSSIAAPSTARIGAGGAYAVFDTAVSGIVEIRDVLHDRVVTTGHALSGPYAIADDVAVVAGAHGGGVRVVALNSDTPPRDVARGRAFDALRLSADGRRLVLERAGAAPEVWDVETNTQVATLDGARHAVLSADGRRALAWTGGQRPVIWDVDAKTVGAVLPTTGAFQPIGFARGGTRVALVETTGARRVSLWDAAAGTKLAERPDSSTAARFDPTRQWLTTIDADHSVTVWSTADGENHASFLGEQLTQAMVNPQGTFVTAIAEYGTVALLMSATDGRILARWPLEHPRPEISEDGFKPPGGSVTWTRDGAAVVSHSSAIGVWPVANRYTRKEIVELVRRNVPWRVENGELSWIRNGKLQGTVVRDGNPVPDATILVEIRTPPDIGAAPINWESSKNRVSTRKITTDADGEFALENLLPGQYTLTVGDHKFFEYVSAEDEPITITLP